MNYQILGQLTNNDDVKVTTSKPIPLDRVLTLRFDADDVIDELKGI